MSAEVEGLRPLPLSPPGSATSTPAPTSVPQYASHSTSTVLMPPPSQPAVGVYKGEYGRAEDHQRHHHHQVTPIIDDTSAQKTPTRDSFLGNSGGKTSAESEQKFHSVSAVLDHKPPRGAISMGTEESLASNKLPEKRSSANINSSSEQNASVSTLLAPPLKSSEDIAMDDAADDENEGVSDNEDGSVGSDRPVKKKKGQRFFCTDFPPCQLSFTRSEHLARHIRKHTGERPFQCHCLRRFSRLDNLRQHAQTVHVNEEIPGDSLAATGTRFQKQIRTDRMRTPGGRHRASTISSGSIAHSRGHSRNWSNSSIGSITSEIGSPDDFRRRQQPLAMAQTSPSRPMTMETFSSHSSISEGPYHNYMNGPSSGMSTPVSSRYSATADSPGVRSPITLMSGPISYGDRTPSRRLSVPSSSNPFAYSPSVQFMSPLLSSTASTFPSNATLYGSPTSTVFSEDKGDSLADVEYRRRTWHPSSNPNATNRPATSGLSYYQTSANNSTNSTPPTQTMAAAANASSLALSQPLRLPGIDSFDRAHVQPTAPLRRAPSPMEVEEVPSRRSSLIDVKPETRNSRDSWGSINQHLTQLDIDHLSSIPAPRDPLTWRFPAPNPPTLESRGTPPPLSSSPPSSVLNSQSNPSSGQNHANSGANEPVHTSVSQPANGFEITFQLGDPPVTPRKKKRQAWYNGPIQHQHRRNDTWPGPYVPSPSSSSSAATALANYSNQRTSPEGSTSSEGLATPSTAAGTDFKPAIVHSNGYVEGSLLAGSGAMVEVVSKHAPSRPEVVDYRPLQPLTPPISSHSGKVHVGSGQLQQHTLDQAAPPTGAANGLSQSTAHSRDNLSTSTTRNPTSTDAPPPLSRTAHQNTDRLDALVAVATGASQASETSAAFTTPPSSSVGVSATAPTMVATGAASTT